LKLTTDRHEASRGLFATAELLVYGKKENSTGLHAPRVARFRLLTKRARDVFVQFIHTLDVHGLMHKSLENHLQKY